MALAALDWLEQFMEGFTPHLNKIVIFFLILFLGFLVGKIIGRLTKKLLSELKTDAFFKRAFGWKLGMERGLSSLVAGLIYLISVILALNAVGLTTVVLEIILAVVILTLAISFLIALKDIIPNASAGFTLRQKLKPGTKLTMEDAQGTVKEVTLLETVIETKKKDTIVIPNALFAKQRIKIRK